MSSQQDQSQKKLKELLQKLNVSKHICVHLIGKHHTKKHQQITGAAVMFTGVIIAKSAVHGSVIEAVFFDVVGYAIHGIGLIPFVETIISTAENNNSLPFEDKKEEEINDEKENENNTNQ